VYRRLLIPVSEPPEVEPMIRFGAALLDADGEIRVLHVIPTTTLPEVTRQWRASVNLVIPAHEAGAALDVRVEPEVRASVDVAGEILESAENHAVDGILMTLRGDRRTRGPFFGHTASAVLHHAHCDVIIVNRLALVEERIPRILIPTFSAFPPPKALRLAEEIALRHSGVPIVTLRLGSRDAANAPDDAGPLRSPRGVPMAHRQSFISTALLGRRRRLPELILQQAQRERFGLLLVGEESVSAEGPLLTRRFLEELFRGAPCPVMAVRG
jgi:nucleotide-binding universal stress UspA family protein